MATDTDSQDLAMNIATIMDNMPLRRYHIELTIGIGISWTYQAMLVMIPLTIALECDWFLSGYEQSMFNSTMFIGGLFGSIAGGVVSDRYGRRFTIVLAAALVSVFTLQSSIAPTFAWLFLLRAINGFVMTWIVQISTLTAELVPTKYRGPLVISMSIFWAIGTLLGAITCGLILPVSRADRGWRYVSAICGVSPIVFILWAVFRLVESPKWLLSKGEHTLAMKQFEILSKRCGIPIPSRSRSRPVGPLSEESTQLVSIERNAQTNTNTSSSNSHSPHQPKATKFTETIRLVMRGDVNAKEASAKRGLWSTAVLLLLIWFAMSFSYFGQFYFATELLKFGGLCSLQSQVWGDEHQRMTCPIECDLMTFGYYVDNSLTQMAELPGIVLAMVTVQYGRKLNMIIYFVLMTLATTPLLLCQPPYWVLLLSLIFCKMLGGGVYMVLILYTTEMFPTSIRGQFTAICLAFSRVGGFATSFFGTWFIRIRPSAIIIVYIAVGFAAAFFSWLLPFDSGTKKGETEKSNESLELDEDRSKPEENTVKGKADTKNKHTNAAMDSKSSRQNSRAESITDTKLKQ